MRRMELGNWLGRKSVGRKSVRLDQRLAFEFLESREVLTLVVWSPSVDLPLARQDAAAVLSADGAVYLLGGNTTNVDILASGSGSWSSGDSIDKQRVAPGAGLVADGRIFLFGGQDGGQAIEETYLYDPLGSDPQDGAVMSIERARGAYATDPQSGLIYALGGMDSEGSLLGTAEAYDPATDSWSSVASLPGGRADFAAAADEVGHIFTFGGSRAGYGSNDVDARRAGHECARPWPGPALGPWPEIKKEIAVLETLLEWQSQLSR